MHVEVLRGLPPALRVSLFSTRTTMAEYEAHAGVVNDHLLWSIDAAHSSTPEPTHIHRPRERREASRLRKESDGALPSRRK